jgi:hypothetical protein
MTDVWFLSTYFVYRPDDGLQVLLGQRRVDWQRKNLGGGPLGFRQREVIAQLQIDLLPVDGDRVINGAAHAALFQGLNGGVAPVARGAAA